MDRDGISLRTRFIITEAPASKPAAAAVVVQNLSDEDLLRLCAAGKSDALEELVRRYQAPLYRFLSRYLAPTDDTEQAVLNVFISAWRNAPRFQFRSRVSTWLYRIATNLAHDMRARQCARPQQDPWPESTDGADIAKNAEREALEHLQQEDRSRSLERALLKLSEGDRLILILYYFEERTYEEIQEIANVSYKVLKTRLMRARQRLRRILDVESEDIGL